MSCLRSSPPISLFPAPCLRLYRQPAPAIPPATSPPPPTSIFYSLRGVVFPRLCVPTFLFLALIIVGVDREGFTSGEDQ